MKIIYTESFWAKARRRRRKKLIAMRDAAAQNGDTAQVQAINEELKTIPEV